VAFTKRHDGQRLIQARLHYIELAENLSFHIPGFRETYNIFPKEIYFSATAKEIEEYHEEALKTHVQKLETQLSEQKELVQQQLKLQQEVVQRQLNLQQELAQQQLTLQQELAQQQLTLQQGQARQQFQELKDLLLTRCR